MWYLVKYIFFGGHFELQNGGYTQIIYIYIIYILIQVYYVCQNCDSHQNEYHKYIISCLKYTCNSDPLFK